MKKTIKTIQQLHMLVLMGGKFLVDMFLAVLPAILPELREQFALSLTAGVTIIFAMQITANVVQAAMGHMRADKRKPFFIIVALVCAGALCLAGVLPRKPSAIFSLMALAVVSGCGNGFYNPEALRAVHRLDRISPAMSSALFTSSGYAGYAVGGLVAAVVVQHFGLSGLYVLPLFPLCAIFGVVLSRIRLFIERPQNDFNGTPLPSGHVPFWPLMAMGTSAAVSAHLLSWLLPTRLRELGFELDFGGLSVMVFCLGAVVGAFFWAKISHRTSPLSSTIAALLLGALFTAAYLLLMESRASIVLLFFAGFNALATFPLTVTMARAARGLTLGRRMGFIIGGVWGTASLVVAALGPIGDRLGVQALLRIAPFCFAIAGIIGMLMAIYLWRRRAAIS